MSFAPAALSLPGSFTSVTTLIAQQPNPSDPGGQGEDFGKSSPLGLLVLILFLIAVVFLVRSMSKHLKRLPASFDKTELASDVEASDTKAIGDSADASSVEVAEFKPKPDETSKTKASDSAEI
jgi:hypothetical protein